KMTELLLDANANPIVQDRDGETPLHLAAKREKIEIMLRLLISDSENSLEKQNIKGRTPLHIASEYRNFWSTQILLASKANPEVKDSQGHTPFHLAAKQACSDIVSLLLENGANHEALDNQNMQPLDHILSEKKDFSIIKIIAKHQRKLQDQ